MGRRSPLRPGQVDVSEGSMSIPSIARLRAYATPRPIQSNVAAAALWLRRRNMAPQHVVLTLKEHFQLDTVAALEAIALARGLEVRRAAE
jgi:hypothetical protein